MSSSVSQQRVDVVWQEQTAVPIALAQESQYCHIEFRIYRSPSPTQASTVTLSSESAAAATELTRGQLATELTHGQLPRAYLLKDGVLLLQVRDTAGRSSTIPCRPVGESACAKSV